MEQLKYWEYPNHWDVCNELEKLGEIRIRYGSWVYEPKNNIFLTDGELVAILAKLGALNKNPKVIVIGG